MAAIEVEGSTPVSGRCRGGASRSRTTGRFGRGGARPGGRPDPSLKGQAAGRRHGPGPATRARHNGATRRLSRRAGRPGCAPASPPGPPPRPRTGGRRRRVPLGTPFLPCDLSEETVCLGPGHPQRIKRGSPKHYRTMPTD